MATIAVFPILILVALLGLVVLVGLIALIAHPKTRVAGVVLSVVLLLLLGFGAVFGLAALFWVRGAPVEVHREMTLQQQRMIESHRALGGQRELPMGNRIVWELTEHMTGTAPHSPPGPSESPPPSPEPPEPPPSEPPVAPSTEPPPGQPEPAPAEPAPAEPAPAEPAPAGVASGEPAPGEPAPAEPAPGEPLPAESVPAEAAAVEPPTGEAASSMPSQPDDAPTAAEDKEGESPEAATAPADGSRAEPDAAGASGPSTEAPASAAQSASAAKPAWVGRPAHRGELGYEMSLTVGPFTTALECESNVPAAVATAADQYAEAYLGHGWSQRVRLPGELLRNQVVDRWEETIQASFGPMIQWHVLVRFDDKFNALLREAKRRAIVAERLWLVGVSATAVLALLGLAYVGLRVGRRLGGKRRAALAAFELAAAGAVIASAYWALRWAELGGSASAAGPWSWMG